MPGKQLVTERDVLALAPGGRLVLNAGRIATPSALDAAFSRGIQVIYGEESDPPPPSNSDLWARMKAADGTFVVQVQGGRVTVSRLGPQGPEPFGTE